MDKHKYIVYRTEEGFLSFLIFPAIHIHSDFKSFKPLSAGFVRLSLGEDGSPNYECYGESISLGLKSRKEKDSELLNENQ